MDGLSPVMDLAEAGAAGRDVVGGKARVLGELLAAGLPVPPGFVVLAAPAGDPDGPDAPLAEQGRRVGGDRFAVRSSAAAEDLTDASYAGLYETYLNVEADGLAQAVRRCFASATAQRVARYHDAHGAPAVRRAGMAVLVQRMVEPVAAGVAFTAHPVTGDREQTVVTAVAGLGERLVSGEATGEEWTVRAARAGRTRPGVEGRPVLDAAQAVDVAELARRVADRYGSPQDIEWAIDADGRLWLLQARPMTALPEQVSWTPPGPGLWMRNFRLGEWLPEAVTPLFATWLLPGLEQAYLDGMHEYIGVRVPFRYTLLHGWYYTATPVPSVRLLARVLGRGRSRAVRVLFYALIRLGRDPAAADRHALADLYRRWRDRLPSYRRLVDDAAAQLPEATPQRLAGIVDEVAHEAGVHLWYLAIVGGSAWKMEAALGRFCREHLPDTLAGIDGGVQALLRGLPGTAPTQVPSYAVQSVDWYHPTAGELPAAPATDPASAAVRHRRLTDQRLAAQSACRAALCDRPRLRARFDTLLDVTQRYAVIREQQARELTLGWPLLRAGVHRLGEHLAAAGTITEVDDVYFCTRPELDGRRASLAGIVSQRRREWDRRRRLLAPLTLGHPPRIVGDLIEAAVRDARGDGAVPDGAIVGQPASAGRATGPVRLVHGPADFAGFRDGDVLVAKATAPAWTPLFDRAAAVVTDGGTLAAHASLIAREYGIPAVVGTTDATSRLTTGQVVTVDGSAGTVTPA